MSKHPLPPDQDPDFVPTHCPNRHCRFHLPSDEPWPKRKSGFYERRSDGAKFQLYLCLHCRRRFSTRAFCADYWLRYRQLLPQIASLASNGTGLRQAGRHLQVSHTTIGRHLARLGRHCLVFQRQLTQSLTIDEPVAFDGFETFEFSQFHPFHLNVAAGKDSWFLYEVTDAPLRRKGRMTAAQKARRKVLENELGRPDPAAIEIGVERLIGALLEKAPTDGTLELESDEHPAYRKVVTRLRSRTELRVSITHRTTNSRRARTADNPLFAVNLTDLLLRHSQANHRRETIAFSKRRQRAMDRAHIFQVWRNAVKRRRENGTDETAAMRIGLATHPMGWNDVLGRRCFPHHQPLEPWRMEYYRGEIKTAALKDRQSRHELKRAF